MAGTFRVHRAAAKLAGKPRGEVADVDHLLNLTNALRANLPHFQRHQFTERFAKITQTITEIPNQLPPERGRHAAPFQECSLSPGNDHIVLSGIRQHHISNSFAGRW